MIGDKKARALPMWGATFHEYGLECGRFRFGGER
jgi:hypothetical protein